MCLTCIDLQTNFGDGVECLKAEVAGLLAKYEHYSSGVVRLEVKLQLHACDCVCMITTLDLSLSLKSKQHDMASDRARSCHL